MLIYHFDHGQIPLFNAHDSMQNPGQSWIFQKTRMTWTKYVANPDDLTWIQP